MADIYATPIDQVTFDDVVEFCARGIAEHIRLEYKQEFSRNDAAKQVAKLAAAFANTQGGLVIFGVVEDEKTRRPKPDHGGTELGNNPRAVVQSACAHNVFPPITPEVSEFLPNPNSSTRGFLIARIPSSIDIHTIDDGQGIYVRFGDQSEPMRATLDTIEHLLERKRRAIDLQHDRREKYMSLLRSVLGNTSIDGSVWVSIGPTVATCPLCDTKQLLECIEQVSVKSQYYNNRRVPIESTYAARVAQDCVYSIDSDCQPAGLVDVFGNVIMFARLRHDRNLPNIELSNEHRKEIRVTECGKYACIDVERLCELLLSTLRVVRSYYSVFSFAGYVSCELRAINVRGTCLLFGRERNHWPRTLGWSPFEDEIRMNERVFSTDIDDFGGRLLLNMAERVLWSWGFKDAAKHAPVFVDHAERLHFGSIRCKCGNNDRAVKRDLCFDCRSRATALQ